MFRTRVKHLPWLDSISIANHTFTLYCEDHDDAQFSIDNVAVRPTTSPGGCDNDSDCDRGDNKSSDVESDDMPIVRRNRDSINGRSGALSDDDHVVRITRSGSNSTDGSDGQSAAHRFWDEGIAMYFDPIRPDQLAQVSVCDADECRRSDPSFILPPPISISDRDLRIDHDDLYLPSFLDVQAICHRLGLDPAAGRDEPVIHVLIATDLGHVLCQFDCGDGSRRGRARSGFRALASVNPEVGEDGDLLSELVHLQHELSLQVAELNGFRTSILHAMSDEDYASVATVTENERQQTQVDYLHVARWQSVRMALIRGVRDVDAASVGTDQDHYNTSCRVCFGTDGSELNPIVICELCGLAVHKCCYGIDTIPDDDWHCDPCANPAESRPEHECLLCPVSGFAFKPSDAGGPVHLTCALWNPIAHVADVVTMSPIAGVASAIEASAGSVCSICKQRYGSTLPCSCEDVQCPETMHATCAWEHGLYMRVDAVGTDLYFYLFCESHTPSYADGTSRDRLGQHMVRILARTRPPAPATEMKLEGSEGDLAVSSGVGLVAPRSLDGEDIYLPDVCSVCFLFGNESEGLTICTRCGIAVHLSCYTNGNASARVRWRCRRCQSGHERTRTVRCELCPRLGGAYQQTETGKWAHVACSVSFPDVIVTASRILVGKFLATMARRHRATPVCAICSRRSGFTIECGHAECSQQMHPLCALFVGCSPGRSGQAMCPSHATLPSQAKISDFYDHLALVRTDLDEVRTILDIIRRREKVKRNLYSIKVEIHEAQETVPPHGQAMEEERASTRLRKRQTTPAVEPVEVQQDVAANRPMARRGRLPKRRTEVEAETAEEAFDNKIPEAPEDHGDLENERRSTRRLTRRVSPERPASPSSVARRRSSTREVPKNGQREKPPTLTKLNGRDEQRTRRRYHALPGSPVKKRRIQSPLRADHRPVSKVKREQSNKPASSRKTDAQRLERSNQFIQILKQCDLSEKDRQRALSFVYKHRQTFKTAKPFQVDDMALASHWGPRLYDCKILEVLPEGSYRIHYHKWTSRYDEVVDASSVYRPTPEARAIQAALEEV